MYGKYRSGNGQTADLTVCGSMYVSRQVVDGAPPYLTVCGRMPGSMLPPT